MSKCFIASASETRARVARARAEYLSQLNYRGMCASRANFLAVQSSDGRAERARSVAGLLINLSLAGMSSTQRQKNQDFQLHMRFRHRYATPDCSGEGRVS